jgi:NADPH-dependent curcumin reductase CurA
LHEATQGGIDVFFDNVAGDILDMGLLCMNKFGRIAQCGAVSAYNSGNTWASKNYFQVITMRLQIKGFIIFDYLPRAAEAIGVFRKALQEGKLKLGDANETVVDTKFEDVPKTWLMLFSGGNTGKLVTKLI